MSAVAHFDRDPETGRFVLINSMSVVEDGRQVASGSLPSLAYVDENSFNQISAALATIGWRLTSAASGRRVGEQMLFDVERAS